MLPQRFKLCSSFFQRILVIQIGIHAVIAPEEEALCINDDHIEHRILSAVSIKYLGLFSKSDHHDQRLFFNIHSNRHYKSAGIDLFLTENLADETLCWIVEPINDYLRAEDVDYLQLQGVWSLDVLSVVNQKIFVVEGSYALLIHFDRGTWIGRNGQDVTAGFEYSNEDKSLRRIQHQHSWALFQFESRRQVKEFVEY